MKSRRFAFQVQSVFNGLIEFVSPLQPQTTLTLSVGHNARQAMDTMKQRRGYEKDDELIRAVLQVYQNLDEEESNGSTIICRRPDGDELEVGLVPEKTSGK